MSKTQPEKARKLALLSIFMVVFIDLIGFGLILPLMPYLALRFDASPFEIGALMAIYSFMQFLFAPLWGALSDRWGRRPLLLMSLVGGGFAYVLFASTTELWVLFLARALAGFFGATISTAQAYIADVTDEKDRSKGMGLIGAAFGLGFIFGPVLGAVLGTWGESLGSTPPLGQSFAAIGAAALCFVNFVFCWFYLKEPKARARQNSSILRSFQVDFSGRKERTFMMFSFFFATLAMSVMEVMLFPFMADEYGWSFQQSSLGFAYVGVVMVFVQGFFLRVVLKRTNDKTLLVVGLSLLALSLYLIPVDLGIWFLAAVMTVLAFGSGFSRPSSLGLISNWTGGEEQGQVLGVTQSLAALARIIGPLFGGWVYESWSRYAVFSVAGSFAILGLMMALLAFYTEKSSQTQSTSLSAL